MPQKKQNNTVKVFKKKISRKRLILYICVSTNLKMTLIKRANIIQILLLILVASSCKNETKEISEAELKDSELPKGILPKMKPLENESPKLTTDYIAEKQKKIDSFYNKTWPNNSMNGAFLVAKNGQILLRKIRRLRQFQGQNPNYK